MNTPTIVRRCHWLNENRASKRPHLLVFLDTEAAITETDGKEQDHTLKFASASFCVYHKKTGLVEMDWRNFTDASELWRWILAKSKNNQALLVIAHNLDYDVRVSKALRTLPEIGAKPRYAIISHGCTFFTFDYDGRSIMLLDNLGIWPASLEEIGKSVGIEKLPINFDTAGFSELAAYCRQDVKILVKQWQCWLSFLDDLDLGNFAITLAGQAFNAYRHRFMSVRIGIHDNPQALELERASYKGGRAEAFYAGKLPEGHYWKLDVNSLYPAAMMHELYPSRLLKTLEGVTPKSLKSLVKDYCVIADVVLDTKEPVFPTRRDGKNCYPTGQFVTTLTTPELDYALDHHYIVGVGRTAIYEPADLFSEYVKTFYDLRQVFTSQNDLARAKICKLLMNSLYGKLGQIGYSQTRLGDAPPEAISVVKWVDAEGAGTCNDVTFGGATFRQITGGEASNSFPAIPAHVAAYGRMYMWQLILKAGRRSVYYIDTDSLIVDKYGYRNLQKLIHPTALGALKVEAESDDVEVFAKKDYRFGSNRTIKGIRSNAVEVQPGVYSQWHFTSLRWGLKHGKTDSVHLDRVQKTMRYGQVVGEFGEDGWLIHPHLELHLNDIEHTMIPYAKKIGYTLEIDRNWMEGLSAKPTDPKYWEWEMDKD